MLAINFEAESPAFTDAAKQYSNLWRHDGPKIVSAIERATGLVFVEQSVVATIYEGVSCSNPLKLRASYDTATKKATIVHELLHRISNEYKLLLPIKGEELSLGLHKQIYLLLYDIWAELYGQAFANSQVAIESARTPLYKDAWDWTLAMSRDERKVTFAELKAASGL